MQRLFLFLHSVACMPLWFMQPQNLARKPASNTVDFIIFFFNAKLLFDFIKSCSGQTDLKFSGVALLSLLFSPKWKRTLFFAKKRYLFQRQVVNFELFRNHAVWKKYTVGKRTVLSILCKFEGLGNIPFQERIKQKWSEKLKMTFLNHFHQGSHPGTGPECVRCTSWSSLTLTAPLLHVVTQKMIIALGSACAHSRRQHAVDRARRVRQVELAACWSDDDAARGRPAQLSYLPSVTGHTCHESALPPPPQSPQKWG